MTDPLYAALERAADAPAPVALSRDVNGWETFAAFLVELGKLSLILPFAMLGVAFLVSLF